MDQLHRRLGKLRLSARGKLRLDDVAGHQHRPHPPPASAAHISRDQPLLGSHQPDHRAVLAVAAKRADDGFGLAPHPRGWK